jgi:hypothetical protein
MKVALEEARQQRDRALDAADEERARAVQYKVRPRAHTHIGLNKGR